MGKVSKSTGINQVYVDQFLSDFAFGIMTSNTGEDFVSGKFAPLTPVPKPSGKYRVLDNKSRAQMETSKALVRAPHTEVSTSDFDWSEDFYVTEEYAHGTHLAPEEVGAADQRVLFQKAKTEYVLNVIRQKHEQAFASKYFIPGVWGNAGSTDVIFGGAGQPKLFSDYILSDPIGVVALVREQMRIRGGKWANVGLISAPVLRCFQNHPQIKNVMSVASDRIVPINLIAKVFNLERLIVAGATKATSVEGATDANSTFDFIFGRHFLLAYMAQNGQPDGLDASAARIFSYNGTVSGPNPELSIPIEVIPRPLVGDERIQAKLNWGHKITGKWLGVLLANCIDPAF